MANASDQLLIAAPEADLMPLLGEVDGQRRAPAAGAENSNRPHYALAPRRRSVPVRRRTTFERCRNRISAAAGVIDRVMKWVFT